jgi:hypothetical protein
MIYLFLNYPRLVIHWRVRCWDLVSWVAWAICGGVRWNEGIDLRNEPAWREREVAAWKEIVGQRKVQVIGWSEAIDLGVEVGLGRTGKHGPGVMVAFSFGPFVAAVENGGSVRVGSKC